MAASKKEQSAGEGIKIGHGEFDLSRDNEARVEIKVGPGKVHWARLAPVRDKDLCFNKGEQDKFQLVFALNKADREKVVEFLTGVGIELCQKSGIKADKAEVEKALRKKIKETEEGSGIFRLNAEQRMAFQDDTEQGFHRVNVPVVGPDNELIEKPYLEREGNEAYMNFMMSPFRNAQSGNILQFPFRLMGVKLSKLNLWQPKDDYDGSEDNHPRRSFTDFSDIEGGY